MLRSPREEQGGGVSNGEAPGLPPETHPCLVSCSELCPAGKGSRQLPGGEILQETLCSPPRRPALSLPRSDGGGAGSLLQGSLRGASGRGRATHREAGEGVRVVLRRVRVGKAEA